MLCAIDGLDGSGKTTVSRLVADILRSHGYDPVVREHPGEGILGRACRRMLLKEGNLALAGASALMVAELLVSGMRIRMDPDGCHVVVRYDLSACFLPDRVSGFALRAMRVMLPRPDMTVMIDVEPDVALGRIDGRGGDTEMFENAESMKRVRRRMASAPGVVVLDGSRPPGETAIEITSMLLDSDDAE